MAKSLPTWMTSRQVAELAAVQPSTVRDWTWEYKVSGGSRGIRRRGRGRAGFHLLDVLAFLDKRGQLDPAYQDMLIGARARGSLV